MGALITIFSTPKPFTNPHIAMIQNNAIGSWMHLGQDVDALLIGEEAGVAEVAKKQGIRLVSDVARNRSGTPLVNSIFQAARENSTTPLLVYVNADILITPDFIETTRQVISQADKILMIGRRWDLEISQSLDFSSDWVGQVNGLVAQTAKLHPTGGSDYFLFPRDCFTNIPDLAIGRAGWDNWMIYHARRQGWQVVDATQSYKAIHQQHDYSHLPGGKPHYRHPESDENVRLAGGRHAIYTLVDATHQLIDGRLVKMPLSWSRFRREIEIFPATVMKAEWLSRFNYFLFHPVKAYWHLRAWGSRKRRALKP
jgi:hypothetical protein